jgi:hypothetical protein
MKLSPAQQFLLDHLINAPLNTPDKVITGCAWKCSQYWPSSRGEGYHWIEGHIYGDFNAATLKVLARKGLIVIHRLGGPYESDDVTLVDS